MELEDKRVVDLLADCDLTGSFNATQPPENQADAFKIGNLILQTGSLMNRASPNRTALFDDDRPGQS